MIALGIWIEANLQGSASHPALSMCANFNCSWDIHSQRETLHLWSDPPSDKCLFSGRKELGGGRGKARKTGKCYSLSCLSVGRRIAAWCWAIPALFRAWRPGSHPLLLLQLTLLHAGEVARGAAATGVKERLCKMAVVPLALHSTTPCFATGGISFLFILAGKGGKWTLHFLTGAYIEWALSMSITHPYLAQAWK